MEIWLTFRNAVKLTLTKTRNWPRLCENPLNLAQCLL
jgi:hypothetical protein